MTKLVHFQKYKLRYEAAILVCYLVINSCLLATSAIMEAKRKGEPLIFQLWEPFVWELSSAISMLMLFPLLVLFLRKTSLEELMQPSNKISAKKADKQNDFLSNTNIYNRLIRSWIHLNSLTYLLLP